MAATSDIRQRQQASSTSPPQGAGGTDDKDGPSALSGLLSCIAGVGGVSLFIWIMFFVFLEPYDPKKAVCTQVGSVDELKGNFFAVIELSKFDWKQFGSGLGLSGAQLEDMAQGDVGADNNVEAVLRSWYGDSKKVCWESVIKSLSAMGEKTSAEQLAEKYKLKI